MPPQEALWLNSLIDLHPDWEVKLWTDENIKDLDLVNPKFLREAKTMAEKSDILRYELVFQFGGVYTDTDIEFLRPIDGILKGIKAFSAMEDSKGIGMSVLGAVPFHPFFGQILEAIKHHRKGKTILDRTGPAFFRRVYKRRRAPIHLFPPHVFFPYHWKQAGHFPPSLNFTARFPRATAVHHWKMSWK